MPTSNTVFNAHTTAQDVVSALSDNVKGKTIVITGANPGGIGGTTAIALAAASPKMLILAGRNEKRLVETAKSIQAIDTSIIIKPVILDLGSQKSVKEAAIDIMNDANVDQIDILINNAGIMNLPDRKLSPEGLEMQLATNHVGHFLFTNLLMPKLLKAAKGSPARSTRIINLSSRAVMYGGFRFSDYNFNKKEADLPVEEHMSQQARQQWNKMEDVPYIPQAAYGQSKTANVLFSVGLNQRYSRDGVLSVAVHPGLVRTELGRNMDQEELRAMMGAVVSRGIPGLFLKTLEQGSSTTLVAALDPKIEESDILHDNCQIADWCPEYATNTEKAEKLWNLSEELVGIVGK